MQPWSWWLSGLALGGIPILNWIVVKRMMAVSGRYTALVDRLRLGPPDEIDEMSAEDLLAAVQAMTAAEFGADSIERPSAGAAAEASVEAPTLVKPPRTPMMHVVFLVSLAAGGLLSTVLEGPPHVTLGLTSASFSTIFGSSPWVMPVVLVFGGMLVGFGTRMSAGCTSGHALCGVSRAQKGSIAATAAFFGMGAVVSLLMGIL